MWHLGEVRVDGWVLGGALVVPLRQLAVCLVLRTERLWVTVVVRLGNRDLWSSAFPMHVNMKLLCVQTGGARVGFSAARAWKRWF